ncbi:DUF445 domain-containing protein [Agaribacter flavus]|uniref:DUF445 domain-containing protein n=1 Tax=Agaribacter flavus TaxID=1902781 RepID=A0ABV7FY10_9ALTE
MNKSVVTNIVALLVLVLGLYLQIDVLFVVGVFALAGAITNSLAVHMLFEKVPGLYGSGVIQIKFEQFKLGIRSLVMEQFFSLENIEKLVQAQAASNSSLDLQAVIEDTDLSPAFDSLVSTIKASSFGGMLNMFGGEEALTPLREPFIENLTASVVQISQSDDFKDKLKLAGTHTYDPQAMHKKINALVESRLDELTPAMVKSIIQQMIRSHLGWLVVWGGFFGGLIGLLAHLLGI